MYRKKDVYYWFFYKNVIVLKDIKNSN
jgi:hypothetical protein